MKLLYASDLHGNRVLFERLLKRAAEKDVEAVVIGGDLCPRGGATLKEWVAFQRTFLQDYLLSLFKGFRGAYPSKNIYVIMGNDDFRANVDVFLHAEAEGMLKFIHNKKEDLGDGISIIGYSFINTTPFRLKDWEKKDSKDEVVPPQLSPEVLRSVEEEQGTLAEDMSGLSKLSDPKKTIYVIHAPPYGSNLDIISSGAHVGSKSVREFIEKHNPLATLHGHIHESPKMSGSWMDV
ncbi:MAG TPA: metallophosphoesterase, partial [Candidatus Nanoarchaeia archaeon]|nr:metallophosphoesterase [Candidatus Nanoarchaeia archaeon]